MTKDDPRRTLYYRTVPHSGLLCFAPAERAQEIHNINTAQTWGEFRRTVSPTTYQELLNYWLESQDDDDDDDVEPIERPADNEPFSVEEHPGWEEGDFPPWLQAEMGRFIPRHILERHGRRADSVLNGVFWEVAPEAEDRIVADLRKAGVSAFRRDDLVFW